MTPKFGEYIVKSKTKEVDNTYIFALLPKNGKQIDFLPGQYLLVKNPKYKDPEELHPFSIASSPTNKKTLELCIKRYGFWTQALDNIGKGDILMLNGPHGKFIFNDRLKNIVFLVGGLGITPIMSILRYISEKKRPIQVSLIYGSRAPEVIVYKKTLSLLARKMNLKIVNVFSDLKDKNLKKGYCGFITKDIIQKEIKLALNPTFFVVGPPVFIDKMNSALSALSVPRKNIQKELL